MDNLINLSFTMARALSPSLTDSSFKNLGDGMFVHGELGIFVRISNKSGYGVDPSAIACRIAKQSLAAGEAHDLLQSVANLDLEINVDGVDDSGNRRITACAREQIDAHHCLRVRRFLPKFAFGRFQ